jgi:hypothetical protein
MGISAGETPETAGPDAAETDAEATRDDAGFRGEEDLDPDDEDAAGEPSGTSEDDLDPDDDRVDPDDMNIPAAPRDR